MNRGLSGFGAHVEIHRHPLPGAWTRAVQREVLSPIFGTVALPRRILFTLGLADAERERAVAVLAIPVVAKVELGLARPEEGVRRRERGDRSTAGLGGDDPVCRLQRNKR